MKGPSSLMADAMDHAEAAGEEIPCKDRPEDFTSDLLAFTGSGTHQAAVLVRLCKQQCPVLAECRAFADATRPKHGTPLFGVIAGRLEFGHHYVEIDTRELTTV